MTDEKVAGITPGEIRFSPRPNRADLVNWSTWNEESFRRAEEEGKAVFLSISASWCHWCHVMDETTFSDPEVIRLLNERFVPVRVESLSAAAELLLFQDAVTASGEDLSDLAGELPAEACSGWKARQFNPAPLTRALNLYRCGFRVAVIKGHSEEDIRILRRICLLSPDSRLAVKWERTPDPTPQAVEICRPHYCLFRTEEPAELAEYLDLPSQTVKEVLDS